MILHEGGNIWTGDNGTKRINRADVDPTLAWLEKITGVPHRDFKLGTTGIKDTSGDLDIAVNPKDKEQIYNKLMAWIDERNLNPKEWIKKFGVNISFKTPIRGAETNGFVQTDLMFGDQDWMKWSMKGISTDSPFKGKHRHLMMASIAKAKGMMWSFQKGLVDRNTREVISQDPNEIAKKLLGPTGRDEDLNSVESMYAKIKNLPDADKLTADARAAFDKEGIQLENRHYDDLAQLKAIAGL